jgi:hypothetical protein
MSTIALGFLKLYFWYSKKFEIKYVYTYEHSKRTVKNSEENIFFLSIYTATNLLILCSLKYNAISTKTSHGCSGHVYVFIE